MDWKKIVFGLAICLLYIPMVFMAVNTFFPKPPVNDCWGNYKYPMAVPYENMTQEQIFERDEQMRQCDLKFQDELTKYDGWKFIVIMIINILSSIILMTDLDKSIRYGLFFGVIITAFSGTIRYIESRSMLGFGLLVLLFAFVVYLIQRWRTEGE